MPLVLLGLLSGSPTRRAMLRCTWMQVPRFHESVRLLFVVGSNAPGPAVADELRVNVTEGERMRAFCPPGRTCAQKKFDPNKRVQTGSVTTYWKLAAFLTGPNPNPNPGPNPNPNPNPQVASGGGGQKSGLVLVFSQVLGLG